MVMALCYTSTLLIIVFLTLKVDCYEKTLRKIVRNQSKMVQTPFSDRENLIWKNVFKTRGIRQDPSTIQSKTYIHKIPRPKMSTIIATVDNKKREPCKSEKELRNIRNVLTKYRDSTEDTASDSIMGRKTNLVVNKNNPVGDVNPDTVPREPSNTIFFPPHEEQNMSPEKQTNFNEHVKVPEYPKSSNDSSLVKTIYIANFDPSAKSTNNPISQINNADNEYKVDFILPENAPVPANRYDIDNGTTSFCSLIKVTKANIDAPQKFGEFNIEPPWSSKKHFWNYIYDSRYESLMRNSAWPALKVILVPRTHVDTIWKRSFETCHNDSVRSIISNVLKKMQFYLNLTFSWHEVSHLSRWWRTTSAKSRAVLRHFVKTGRLEITTGGWVEPDEATTNLFGLLHQLIEGHQWLHTHLNYTPTTAWLTNTVTHSPTMAYLLSAVGIRNLVITNLHYSWEEFLAEYQYSDFIWLQGWSNDNPITSPLNSVLDKIGKERYPNSAVLTHFLQFNSAGVRTCGPNKAICLNDFNFAKTKKKLDVFSYNVKNKAELLLEQYSKSGTITPHNVIMASIGGSYYYEHQAEFDYQYNNYQQLADYINLNRDIYKATIDFGTPKDYFKAITERVKTYPTLKGDFLNFADLISGVPAYWVGFFTSRPILKILLRRLESTLRSTEILFSFAVNLYAFRSYNTSYLNELLLKSRETLARLLDRNVVSGTLSASALKYAHMEISQTVKNCWYIQEVVTSLMSTRPGVKTIPYLHKYVYRDGEYLSTFKTVSTDDQLYIFNSLSQERTEIIEIMVTNPNVRIIDHNKKFVYIQINPVWKYNSDGFVKISRRYFKIMFAVTVPPLTMELFHVKATFDAFFQSSATLYCGSCLVDELAPVGGQFPFTILPVQPGDVQLESYKFRLVFDEASAFLKIVIEKDTNYVKEVFIDFGAFRSSDINSGMFLFNTNLTKPLQDILMHYRTGSKIKIVLITSGFVATELTVIYGRLLQHTVRIYNLVNSPLANAIYIESKLDYEISPKNRDLEMFMSIQTNIGNGNPPVIYTDNNSFQYTARTLNMSKRIESNVYPITSMIYIQDHRQRLSLITDHAQGATALQEGQLVIMLDRRVLFNDGRGINEGLADSTSTCHRHYILLENFVEKKPSKQKSEGAKEFQLPSSSAIFLANSLNYQIDLFLIEKEDCHLSYYAFLPLIKTSFPCDIAVLNYRAILENNVHEYVLNKALLILHKQTYSCQIKSDHNTRCSKVTEFSLDKIMNNVMGVFKTNLAGTRDGNPIHYFDELKFPPMELISLRLHF